MRCATVDQAARALGPLVRRDVDLGALTTYRVGGRAALLSRPDTRSQLARISAAVADTGVEVLVVGKGSNLLVADAGFPGLVVALGEGFAGIEVAGRSVTAGGAASYPVLARRCAAAGLTGAEWAVGVPGSVGGAVRMNAGGHGSETSQVLSSCTCFDLRTGGVARRAVETLEYSYRHSNVGSHEVVLSADFALEDGDRSASEDALGEVVRWRRANQPGGQNAGSVFTNPPADSAGRLVEEAGLKGFRIGSASVSPKHANFIQADNGGSADDVRSLLEEVRRLVGEQTGVWLETEVRLVGFVH